MTKEELNHILYDITYIDYIKILKEKYGEVSGPFFYLTRNNTWAKNQKIPRGKEGLYIHHMFENLFIDLSNIDYYKQLLDECKDNEKLLEVVSKTQEPDFLCYCNLLEHLILHMKIALEYNREQYEVGIHFIALDLTHYYDLGDNNLIKATFSAKNHQWKQQVYYNIKDDYEIYVELCKVGINQLNLDPNIFLLDWFGCKYEKLAKDLNIT